MITGEIGAQRARLGVNGSPIVGWASLALSAMVLVTLFVFGAGEEGIRAVIRYTARTSLTLFTAAFVASSLRRLKPAPFTRWLLTNRRYLGVSFAVSHAMHLAAILTLARVSSAFVAEVDRTTVIFGGLGFVFAGLLAATSFDRTAAWLGPRRWRVLHKTGVYYLWLIFFITYLQPALQFPSYAPFIVILLGAMGVRVWAARVAPRRDAT
jgi:DMSO/TMAO reductase YedYZ heme-binding membrane subunit